MDVPQHGCMTPLVGTLEDRLFCGFAHVRFGDMCECRPAKIAKNPEAGMPLADVFSGKGAGYFKKG